MSAIWKNTKGPILIRDEKQFDAATRLYFRNRVWQGSEAAIAGLELGFQDTGYNYTVTNDGPIYQIATRVNLTDPDTEAVDRYEISTESTEREIWRIPAVFQEAKLLANTQGPGDRTYRQQAEDMAENNTPPDLDTAANGPFPLFLSVVANLIGGTPGFPVDYILLRRFRRVEIQFSQGITGKMNLDDGKILYTTAQLQLPNDIAFVVPNPPAALTEFDRFFLWSWRKRAQRTEFIDQWVEQTIELLFAPHELLDNRIASGNLAW